MSSRHLKPPEARSGIIKEGFLVKKGHVRHSWRTRWFVLARDSLSYFKKRADSSPAGIIPLVGASLTCLSPATPRKAGSSAQWRMQLETHGKSRVYHIQAPDLVSRDEWKESIEKSIRRLDPTKLQLGKATLSRSMSVKSHSGQRDIVQAMQDKTAGVALHECKPRASKQAFQYFVGKDAIDWLYSWSFASDRSAAIVLASSILRHGFLRPVNLDEGRGTSVQTDVIWRHQFIDSEDAHYVFVVFAPGQSVDLFDSDESDSDSDDDLLSTRAPFPSGADLSGERVLRQGFLLKKGHLRHNWKPRRFLLKDKALYLYYYKGCKSPKPEGGIPLMNLTVIELDDEDADPSEPADRRPRKKSRASTRLNRMALITSTGQRHILEAPSAEDRNAWVAELQIAIASQLITPS